MPIDKIVVKGIKVTPPLTEDAAGDMYLIPEESFLVGSSVRGEGESHVIDIKDDKIVEMVFDDGTRWFSGPDNLDLIFPEATAQSRSGNEAFVIPDSLSNFDNERGILGDIALKTLNVFIKKTVDKTAADAAADLERKLLDDQSGLYKIDSNFELKEFTDENSNKIYLLFLHGTASSTKGSFSKLNGTGLWNYITSTYGNNILGFQHESLTKSPLQNVLELVKQLPQNISLHIISHSRGGLVGDTLSRFCSSNENINGFDTNEINLLKDHGHDIAAIHLIKEEIKNKTISVDKFIRVACPAGGTTLASKRLDTFFNIVMNLIGLGTGLIGNPVYSAFKNLIAAVVDTKNNVNVLPGLEAMDPGSPFIKVLNLPSSAAVIDHPLTVISGNCKIDFNLKALAIIASRIFFFTDSDLVVDTRSMYKGSKRSNAVQYFFDETETVDHFSYFKNKITGDAILKALSAENDNSIPGFKPVQADMLRGAERSGSESGALFKEKVTGTKPIVVLLPGLLGSNLSKDGQQLWINYQKLLDGGIRDLDISAEGIEANSIVKSSYKDLDEYLSENYDVVTFPYDWRNSANKTADLFNNKINELIRYRQPVKIIAHSAGGVVVRDFILKYKETWKILNQSQGFKLVFMGSPLGGTYRIPAMLLSKDKIINKLERIDSLHNGKDLAKIFSQWPGLLSLLPVSGDIDLTNIDVWKKFSSSLTDDWPLPGTADLEEFKILRDSVTGSFEKADLKNAVYIAGKDRSTPCGFRIDKTMEGDELIFLSTGEGDGLALWSEIPKNIKTVYYAAVTNGELAKDRSMFKAIVDILETGSTNLFSNTKPVIRGDEKLFRTPEDFDFDLSPVGVENTILGLGEKSKTIFKPAPVKVSVSNGDLKYSSYPVLAGHFLNDGILYAEKSINYNLKGELTERHRLGIYPGEVGSSEIFIPGGNEFKGAVIVGMGIVDDFTAFQLTQTIEQGISKYLLNINSKANLNNNFVFQSSDLVGITSLIIGSGYAGLSVENSVRAIIQGVQNANDKLLKLDEGNKTIQHIEFIELYENTALRCFYAIRKIAAEENKSLIVALDSNRIKKLFGSRDRIAVDAAEGWWNRITIKNITLEKFKQENLPYVKKLTSPKTRILQFNVSTGSAREEQRSLKSNVSIVEELSEDISQNNKWTKELAKTIFELLIPNDFKEQFRRQGNINFILDKDTASYPWELLQDSTGDAKPLCVNSGMIRQLTTQDYRIKIKAVSNDNALVIADPELKGFVNQLPGALREGEHVSGLISAKGFNTTKILRGNSPEIIKGLLSKDYRIIHLAGHGFFDKNSPEKSGMVIGKNIFLTTNEISQMGTVPELVFINCCFLGQIEGEAEELSRNRYKLAANIGTQLIENGVKAVVAAGWAVDDAAALDFAKVFYDKMFDGYSFGDAVLSARKYVYEMYKKTNTWGAYQCYGDPFYRLKSGPLTKSDNTLNFVIEQEAEIELNNLINDMETNSYSNDEFLVRLNAISKAVDDAGLRNAELTEKEALVYSYIGEYDSAVNKFDELMKMEDSLFTVSTLEEFYNVRVKKYVRDFLSTKEERKDFLPEVEKVIKDMENLINLNPTARRYVIMGSTFKRKSILCGTNIEDKIKAYKEAASFYSKALLKQNKKYERYALINCIEMESLLSVLENNRGWDLKFSFENKDYNLKSPEDAAKLLKKIIGSLELPKGNLNFWDKLAPANLKLCAVMLNSSSAGNEKDWDEVFDAYRRVWSQAGSKGRKITEIEYLDFLFDAYSHADIKNNNGTHTGKITQLKEELKKLL